MRKWTCGGSAGSTTDHAQVLAGLIQQLGQPGFRSLLLESLQPLVPAASFSVYRTGHRSVPQLYLSGSLGVPDTTQACWRAYLSGPYLRDRTLMGETAGEAQSLLCHLTAQEVPAEHRARVYEAHGVAERVSVVQAREDGLFAVNFYRHQHQRPFSDLRVLGARVVGVGTQACRVGRNATGCRSVGARFGAAAACAAAGTDAA